MPLTLPVDEAILQEIAERLETIDGVSVVQYRREPGNWTPENRQICVVRKSPERAPELDYPGNPPALAYKMTVNLRLHIMQSETDTDNNSALLSTFAADVHECVCGVANWYQWNAKAVNTELGTTDFPSPTGSFDVAVVPLVITYRHSEGDPYEVR
jgi:hypothetical protein